MENPLIWNKWSLNDISLPLSNNVLLLNLKKLWSEWMNCLKSLSNDLPNSLTSAIELYIQQTFFQHVSTLAKNINSLIKNTHNKSFFPRLNNAQVYGIRRTAKITCMLPSKSSRWRTAFYTNIQFWHYWISSYLPIQISRQKFQHLFAHQFSTVHVNLTVICCVITVTLVKSSQ